MRRVQMAESSAERQMRNDMHSIASSMKSMDRALNDIRGMLASLMPKRELDEEEMDEGTNKS